MNLLDDLSVARRRLARAPGFAALAVGTLALGIGAHTAIFGLVDRLFLRDLPVAEPDWTARDSTPSPSTTSGVSAFCGRRPGRWGRRSSESAP